MAGQTFRKRMEAIIAMTRQMLEVSREGEWARFHELETRRRQEIKALFATPPLGEEAQYAVTAIEEVLAMDQTLIRFCESEKRACADQISLIRRGQRVRDAYSGQQHEAHYL